MPSGNQPSGRAFLTTVDITWTPATLPGGVAVQGYEITRINATTGAQVPAANGCSGIVTADSCVETSVPPGTWFYTDTPVEALWTGPASPDSASFVTRLG
jgi:hypothetical protein